MNEDFKWVYDGLVHGGKNTITYQLADIAEFHHTKGTQTESGGEKEQVKSKEEDLSEKKTEVRTNLYTC